MFVIVFMALVLAGMMGGLVYLWDFSRASRRDALFLPASDRRARRARRVTGMYVRDYARRDDELVGRW
ncbi:MULTISPECIES: hypothetical protein [Actinomadura]|uniref:hypothetical protein n=1 Tax=Actinomadura TaxID=1988 RepID=UPI0003AD23D4|nr:hypothetical protein [Actinomadura madurae]MCP9949276.1 hypothetical protein [Actinomadura madurae]MCP9978515.1 hypothetical protein [Actinomadura madurae]MCQ0009955.1 hypothetical protein [Actinomadura madurae]MCQ0014720.1 hypothetical protein [Actinomadura madurae]URM94853.1 hypothetical protein LUW76_11250 [Actinomadura madurae]